MQLHHIALGARDVEGVARFYEEIFALERRRAHYHEDGSLRSIWLMIDSIILMVEHSEQAPRRVEGVGAGPFLLAFELERGAFEAHLDALARRGIPVEARTEFSAYFRDPEGNRVAISHYSDEA